MGFKSNSTGSYGAVSEQIEGNSKVMFEKLAIRLANWYSTGSLGAISEQFGSNFQWRAMEGPPAGHQWATSGPLLTRLFRPPIKFNWAANYDAIKSSTSIYVENQSINVALGGPHSSTQIKFNSINSSILSTSIDSSFRYYFIHFTNKLLS